MRQQEKIMVVSGNHDAQYLTEILANGGYQVLHAERNDDVLSLVRTTNPDLILIEPSDSGIEGDAFIRELIRIREPIPIPIPIPIILLLSQPDTEPDWEMFGRSIADCIRIPYSQGELVARVRTQLELNRLCRTVQEQTTGLNELYHDREQEKSPGKNAEEVPAEGGDFYLKVLDDFPNPVWRANVTAKCDFFNKFWLEFTGRTMEEEMGDGWAEGVHPDDFDRCLAIYLDNFHLRKPFEMEYRLRFHDGSYHWLLDCGNPFYTPDGEFGGYIGSCYDIQDRKTAEALLNAANTELEERIRELTENRLELLETKEYLEKLIGYASAPILVWDPSLMITKVNKAFGDLTGIEPEEATGEHISLIFSSDSLQKYQDLTARMTNSSEWEGIEIPITRRSGETRIVLWNFASIVSQHNEPIATIAQGHDITEHIQAEKALKQLNRQLNLMSSITRHDILNQVNVIELLIGLVQKKTDTSAIRFEMEGMTISADNIRSQIEFTKTYQEIGSQDPQWQDVCSIAVPGHIPQTITVITRGEEIEVYADLLLRRVFDNLLDNSIRHGERVSRIEVSCMKSPSGLVIVWEDNGVGVRADEKEMIFDRGIGKNTGLGLFFIREILLITGITISETGEEGKGARFEILVPSTGWRYRNHQTRPED